MGGMKQNLSLGPVRRRRSAAQIIQLMEQYTGSGLTQREFSRSTGVGYSTFTSWLRRGRRKPAAAARPWVAVDVVKAASSGSCVRYQVEWPNGMRISVGGGFDAQEVGQLLNLVGACSR
jgi:biotin-(acetyl-CoA carboxylase) ligase